MVGKIFIFGFYFTFLHLSFSFAMDKENFSVEDESEDEHMPLLSHNKELQFKVPIINGWSELPEDILKKLFYYIVKISAFVRTVKRRNSTVTHAERCSACQYFNCSRPYNFLMTLVTYSLYGDVRLFLAT